MNRMCTIVLAAGFSMACAPRHPFVWVDQLADAPDTTAIRPGDKIFVEVRGQEKLSGEHEVQADGHFIQPLVGHVKVSNMSTTDAGKQIAKKLDGIVVSPVVRVSLRSPKPPVVSVLGEVRQAGRFQFEQGEGVLEALARAGGITEFADKEGIFVLRNGKQVEQGKNVEEGKQVEQDKQVEQVERIRFRYHDLTGGKPASISFELHDGDVVVVE